MIFSGANAVTLESVYFLLLLLEIHACMNKLQMTKIRPGRRLGVFFLCSLLSLFSGRDELHLFCHNGAYLQLKQMYDGTTLHITTRLRL